MPHSNCSDCRPPTTSFSSKPIGTVESLARMLQHSVERLHYIANMVDQLYRPVPKRKEGGGVRMCHDALSRNESCGAHFREEYQYPDGEAKRDDEHYSYVSAWEFKGVGHPPALHKEPLVFEEVHPSVRSYK